MPTPVDQIKERLDPVELIGRYVPLKKAGRTYKGLCPFHSEKTPSFVVYPDDGHYHCFGCGQNGDIFTIVMRLENLDFGDALRLLADRAGVVLETRPEAAVEDRARDHIREINRTAAQFFHNLLLRSPSAQIARDFLARRGVNAQTIAAWELGYSQDSWHELTSYMVERGITVPDLLAAGVVKRRAQEDQQADEDAAVTADDVYDYFRGRVMFPIRDAKGQVTGFGARTLSDEQPKFLNSPQTLTFDKSASLYGIDHAREAIRSTGNSVIVEGYLDVLIAHQLGINNVVASLGTALTERQLTQLKRLGKRLVLALDADAAGDEAALRGLTTAREVMDRVAVPVTNWRGLIQFEYRLDADLRVLALPRGEDPDNVILRSVDEWRLLVDQALPVVDFWMRQVTSRANLADPRQKAAAVDQLAPLIREVIDPVAQAEYVRRLSVMTHTDERLVEARVRAASQTGPTRPSDTAESTAAPARRQPATEDYLLFHLLRRPSMFAHLSDLEPGDFEDVQNREIFRAIVREGRAVGTVLVNTLRTGLDPVLVGRLEELAGLDAAMPESSDSDAENEVAVASVRMRLASRKKDLQRLTFTLLDEAAAGDGTQGPSLAADPDSLRTQIGELQRELTERTVLGRRKTAGG
jgi:DNA primase